MRTTTRVLIAVGSVSVAVSAACLAGARHSEGGPRTRLSFARDVAPIIARNCTPCHRPGEVAPFPLLNYSDIRKRARQIEAVVHGRIMPPWKADSHGEFVNERRLTADEIATVERWVDSGAPRGAGGAAPVTRPADPLGELGSPDVEFAPSRPYALSAEGSDVYRCFVIPTHFNADRWISALQVTPGNRSVVHHVLAFVDTTGRARALEAKSTDGPGYSTFGGIGFNPAGIIGGWAPGNLPRPLPDGVGQLLPRGADLVLQVHYHKSGKPERDVTRVGLYFCKGPVDKRYRSAMVIQPWLRIPAGDVDYRAHASLKLLTDATILNVTPHMHLLGREMTVTATPPDRPAVQLVRVPDWDFNWQTTYTFKEPLKVPEGTRLELAARYDNSEANPRNPSRPPKTVTWGEQTTDEMCIAFVGYTEDSEHLAKAQP